MKLYDLAVQPDGIHAQEQVKIDGCGGSLSGQSLWSCGVACGGVRGCFGSTLTATRMADARQQRTSRNLWRVSRHGHN